MSIIRRVRNSNFTIVSNAILNDENLSAECLGVLAYLIGKPDNWRVIPENLSNRFSCGKERVYRILKDLIKAGYITRKRYRDDETKAFMSWEYIVFDQPEPLTENPEMGEPLPEKPFTEKPEMEKPFMANRTLLNTEDTNTDSERETDRLCAKPKKEAIQPDWPADYQDQFWQRYPNKKAKGTALKALEKIARGGKIHWNSLMAGLDRYIDSNEVKRGYVKHPATWLNAQCWTDEDGPRPQDGRNLTFFEIAAGMRE